MANSIDLLHKDNKLLIFDGISGVPMAAELHQAFVRQGVDASYVDGQSLERKKFCELRGKLAKSFNKIMEKDGFYHFPKVADQAFREILSREQPDILLVVGFLYRFVSPELVKTLKDEFGFKLYLYDTDSCNFYSRRREFLFFLDSELPLYDHIFSFSKVTTEFFRNARDLEATYFPYGANPIALDKPARYDIDVLFVGSADLRRIFLLEKIRENVTVYGARWARNSGLMSAGLQSRVHAQSVWGDKLHQLLRDSKIVLNITRADFYGAETGMNLRIFEALAAGCFLLTDYCDELQDTFCLGTEIETYRSSDELKEKVAYYLAHDQQRRAIAKRGHEKFLDAYTWDARVLDFCKSLAELQ